MLHAVLRTLVFDVDVLAPGELTRPPSGLDKLAGLGVEDAIKRFIFGMDLGEGATIGYDRAMSFTERRERLRGRRPAITTAGRIGMAPSHARDRDLVCAFAAGMHLYIVREIEDSSPVRYIFVGEAYVHGLMDGEWKAMASVRGPLEIGLV